MTGRPIIRAIVGPLCAVAVVALTAAGQPAAGIDPTPARCCPGDCNGDGRVSIDELFTIINIELGNLDESACACLGPSCGVCNPGLEAVSNALYGCPQ